MSESIDSLSMEETKINAPLISRKRETWESAQWQWQSGSNPFKEADSVKWAWQNYSDDEDLMIEEAYSLNQETVFVKDYEIDLKKMVQISLKDKSKVRSVRRLAPSRFRMETPDAKIIDNDQKTMNEAFGTVQHFLEYIMKRTPEAFSLYRRLETCSLDCQRTEFEDIIHKVVVCIAKGAEAKGKIIRARLGSCKTPIFIKEARKIQDMIENNSSSLRDFLKAILKAYTMETFICYWLNGLLRSEDWEEINVLTPYLVCLVYTFQLSDYLLKDQSSQKSINEKLGFAVKHRLYLYRGTALAEEQLVSYNPNEIQYFSWNAVTSTSRDRNQARKFVDFSLNERANIGVVFFIEIDFDSLEDYHGMIDVSKDSEHPNEQEVILAPGTVFKLLEISLIEDNLYEIRLKVTKDFKKKNENVPLLGVLQEQTITAERSVISGFPSQRCFKVLELLRANQLIRKLDIRNSMIEEFVMEEIENMRRTTHIKKEDINLVDNTIVVSSLSDLAHYFSIESLSTLLSFNEIRFKAETVKSDHISPRLQVENLILNNQTIEKFRQNGHFVELLERLKNEIQTFRVSFSTMEMQIEDNELKHLFECIKEWNVLKDLDLTFNKSQEISASNFSLFSQTISSSITLNHLSLKFPFSDLSSLQNTLKPLEFLRTLSLDCHDESEISDKGLGFLKSELIFLTSLQHLSLKLSKYSFTKEGLEAFINVATSLKSLQSFNLLFRNCKKIEDAGLTFSQSFLTTIPMLQHLSCDFFACGKISSGEDLSSLKIAFTFCPSSEWIQIEIQLSRQPGDPGLFHLNNALTSLMSLQHLDITDRDKISNEKIRHLSSTLRSLKSLQRLSLDFKFRKSISAEGFSDLNTALTSLASLRHLSLNFWFCCNTSDQKLSHLMNTLLSLKSIQYLALNFESCTAISDRGLNHLENAILSLTSLQYLSLGFLSCDKISDEGLSHLSNALLSRTSLQHLSLHFKPCTNKENPIELIDEMEIYLSDEEPGMFEERLWRARGGFQRSYGSSEPDKQISDKGLNHLKKGLLAFASLQHLSLNFESWKNISDEGLNHLTSGLISLASLQHLSMNFKKCEMISDHGLNHLKNALISLVSLQHLSLSFELCWKISDEGLNHLRSALVRLTSLEHLSLNFQSCSKITNEGLNHLKNVLLSLTSLKNLSLIFARCDEISIEGLNHLKSAIILLTSLQSLDMNLDSCKKIRERKVEEFKMTLKWIPSLRISYTKDKPSKQYSYLIF